ncbi:MAG: nuclear transport factor 2 family protein [Thiomicrospira sp.]|jgi:limonene-1,2-epoxide hydrolase|nr:nuclear transport factor 2 family protein [Thiomicrospira sp.]
MSHPSWLNDYKTLFETLTPQSVKQDFSRVFADKVYFKDPFNEVRGVREVQRIFQHMFEQLHEPMFRVHDMAANGQTAYLEWRFYFRRSTNAPVMQINGMSKILCNEQGKIMVHIDYWDSGEYVYRKVPVLSWFIRLIQRRLRA